MTARAALFFGADLVGPAPNLLRRAAAEGQALVALDSQALAWATREHLPHTGLEAWLEADGLTRARRLAPEYEAAWFTPRRELFTCGGLCWPEFDREALYAYWLSACTAHALCQGLTRRGVRRLTVFRREPPRPMLYFEPADTAVLYWQGAFPGQVDCIILPEPETGAQSAGQEDTAPPDFFLHDNLELLRGRAAICLNPLEVFRLRRHIAELRAVFGEKIVLVVNSHLKRDVEPLARETGLPVLGLGPAGKPPVDVLGRCQRGFAELLATQAEPLRGMLQHNGAHFSAVFRRWAWLEATREYWRRAFSAAPPILVAVSNLEDSESQLPVVAARALGINSLSLPHGIGLTRAMRPKADQVLHLGKADREAYLRSGVPAERLVACHDIAIQNEYPVDPDRPWTSATDKLNILVLTSLTGRPGGLYIISSQEAQIRALQALTSPPEDLSGRLELALKPHPGLPDLEIVEVAGAAVSRLLAPLDLPLATAIKAADLVVALNYTGVGVLHCAEAGKPLVQFWLDPDIGYAGPLEFADIFSPAGAITRSVDEFWTAVRRFLNEPEYAQGLAAKARGFARGFHAGERRSLREIAAVFAPQGGGPCAS